MLPIVSGSWCLSIAVLFFQYVSIECSIKAVLMLSRHGDRAPTGTYPTDPYAKHEWPGGFGALSPLGAEQMCESGKIKAIRYQSLLKKLNGTVNFDNLVVKSSAVPRCIYSARNFLNGFLATQWPSELLEVIPHKEDNFLAIHGMTCGNHSLNSSVNYNRDQPEVNGIISTSFERDQFFDYIGNYSGLDTSTILPIRTLADSLKVQQDNGLPLPSWAESVYYSYIKPLGRVVFNKFSTSTYMKIRSGVLLTNILFTLEKSLHGSKDNVVLYFAHDLTESGLMSLMGIINQANLIPNYGAAINFELHDNSKILDDVEVQIFYFDDYSVEHPLKIDIPNCDAPCPFNKLKEIYRSKVVDNYDEACKG